MTFERALGMDDSLLVIWNATIVECGEADKVQTSDEVQTSEMKTGADFYSLLLTEWREVSYNLIEERKVCVLYVDR